MKILKRPLTGLAYLAVIFAFFTARVLLCDVFWGMLLFDVLILLFAQIGTFEMCRAMRDNLSVCQRALVHFFSAAALSIYCGFDLLGQYFSFANIALPALFFAAVCAVMTLVGVLVVRHEKTSLQSIGASLLSLVYPTALLLSLCMVNHMRETGALGILFVFALCPFADCFAFVFGVLFHKIFPKKMAPAVSPNKTVIGGIGGLFGGALGSVCIFFAYFGLIKRTAFPYFQLLYFVLLGLVLALLAEFGDLAESAFKRKIGIKDMGNLLPGHGGVLDRIDSALYVSPLVALVLWIGIMTGV